MPTSTFDLATAGGACKTQIFTPDTTGPWPAVILCFDAGGQRPAMAKIAERIANSGYLVAIPDLYHRIGAITDLLPPGASASDGVRGIFADPELRAKFLSTYF